MSMKESSLDFLALKGLPDTLFISPKRLESLAYFSDANSTNGYYPPHLPENRQRVAPFRSFIAVPQHLYCGFVDLKPHERKNDVAPTLEDSREGAARGQFWRQTVFDAVGGARS